MERLMEVRMTAQRSYKALQNTQEDDIETLGIVIVFNLNHYNSSLTLQYSYGFCEAFRMNLGNNEEQRRQHLWRILSGMEIPFNCDHELSHFVDSIFQYSQFIPQPYMDERGNLVSTEIVVQIYLQRWPQSLEANYDEAAAMAESMEMAVNRSAPSAKSAVEGLEKVKFRGSDETQICAICMEAFPVGLELEVTNVLSSGLTTIILVPSVVFPSK